MDRVPPAACIIMEQLFRAMNARLMTECTQRRDTAGALTVMGMLVGARGALRGD